MTGASSLRAPNSLTSGRGGGPLGEGGMGLPALPDPGLLLLRQDAPMVPVPACHSIPQQHLPRLLNHKQEQKGLHC